MLARNQTGQMTAINPMGRAKKAPCPARRRKSHAERGATARPASSETTYQRAMSSTQFIGWVPRLLRCDVAGSSYRTRGPMLPPEMLADERPVRVPSDPGRSAYCELGQLRFRSMNLTRRQIRQVGPAPALTDGNP